MTPYRTSTSEVIRQRFLTRLRRNGWKRPVANQSIYEHADGGYIAVDNFTDGQTIWRRFVDAGEMPETGEVYR